MSVKGRPLLRPPVSDMPRDLPAQGQWCSCGQQVFWCDQVKAWVDHKHAKGHQAGPNRHPHNTRGRTPRDE